MILAIEAASTDLSVALATSDGTPVATDAWTSERRQSAELLPRVLALLEREGMALDGVTAVAVGTGPGSFTGLRVAMALAKGMAVGLRVPIVGVPSLRSWLDAEAEAEAAVARAGAHDAFVLRRDSSAPIVLDEASVGELAMAAVVAPREVADAFGLSRATGPTRAAEAMARSAARRLSERPGGDDPATLDPVYGRAPRGVTEVVAPWR